MAMTVNGFVADSHDEVGFVSKASWEMYHTFVTKVGALIVGRRTYELMVEAGEVGEDGGTHRDVQIVVVTRKKDFLPHGPAMVADSPARALELLSAKGFEEAILGRGGSLNGSFMREALVDEIILDVEPAVIGEGIKLFGESDGGIEAKVKLMESKEFAPGEMRLHYKVEK